MLNNTTADILKRPEGSSSHRTDANVQLITSVERNSVDAVLAAACEPYTLAGIELCELKAGRVLTTDFQ